MTPTPPLVLGLTAPDSAGHAVPDGGLVALCGTTVEATVALPYPDGGVCCRFG